MRRAVCLQTGRPAAGPTIVRDERHRGERSDRRAGRLRPRRPRAVRRAGLEQRRGADARVHERAGARAHARRPASCTCGAARAASSGTRAPPAATRSACGRCAWTATATRCSRSSSRRARPATRASAPAFTAASSSRRRRTRRCRSSSARSPSARASAPRGSYTVELLDDPPRIGEKVMEEAEEVARAAREESDERVDEEAADVLYHLLVLLRSRGRCARGRRAGARWPSLLAPTRTRARGAPRPSRSSRALERGARAGARATT